jgi:hypothetical protein
MLDVQEGQDLSESSIQELLGDGEYPTRSEVASLLVRKFMPTFASYFSLQGNNIEYYKALLPKLRGKKYVDQYAIMLSQIKVLEENDKEHGSAETIP